MWSFLQTYWWIFYYLLYFKPIATKVVELCKDLGVLITPAGSTFPNNNDPKDSVIRLAQHCVSKDELEVAMEVLQLLLVAHYDIDI